MQIKRQVILRELIIANILWASVISFVLAFILNLLQQREFFILKDIFFYVSVPLIFILVRSYKLTKFIFYILLFCIYIISITAIFFELKSWQVYNLRQLVAPLLILSVSYSLSFDVNNTERVIAFGTKSIIWVVIAGIAFLVVDFWSYFNLNAYFTLKGIPVDARGVSYMFYEPALGYAQRMVSTFLDPINLGHTIAAVLIVVYYRLFIGGDRRKLYLVILTIGLLLTFSKGAILQVVLALFFLNKKISYVNRILIPLGFIGTVLLLIDLKGILIHLHGLTNSIININFFGHGFGMVGNYAKMFANDLTIYNKLKISDTFIGSVIGQIGIVGLVFWLSFFGKHFYSVTLGRVNNIGSIIIISQLIVSIISENTLNFNSFLIPGLIAGVAYNFSKNHQLTHAEDNTIKQEYTREDI